MTPSSNTPRSTSRVAGLLALPLDTLLGMLSHPPTVVRPVRVVDTPSGEVPCAPTDVESST